MNKKILLTIMIGMFLISFASAFDSHKQNTDYDLTISHNTATSCQATWIKFPNGTQNILNSDMTQDGTTFYTTISSGNFSSLGTTCLGISCTDGSTNEVGSKCLEVNSTGTQNESWLFGIFFIVLLVFGGFINYLAYLKPENFAYNIFAGMMFGVAGLIAITINFAAIDNELIGMGIGYLAIGYGALLIFNEIGTLAESLNK